MLENLVKTESECIKDIDKMSKQRPYLYNAYFLPALAQSIEYNGTHWPLSEHYNTAYEKALTMYRQESMRR